MTCFHIFCISICFTFVVCSKESDLDCIKKGVDSMQKEARGVKNVRDDKVLLESAQRNLRTGIEMINRRTHSTKLDCYYDFAKKYSKGLKQIMDELNDRLAKARDSTERSEAVSTIATMSQVMRCDEEHKARHMNDTVMCTRMEDFGGAESKFNSLYNILKGRVFLGSIIDTNKNKVIEGIINYDLQIYSKMYGEAKTCVSRQRKADRCPNLKIFIDELERFFSLFDLIYSKYKIRI